MFDLNTYHANLSATERSATVYYAPVAQVERQDNDVFVALHLVRPTDTVLCYGVTRVEQGASYFAAEFASAAEAGAAACKLGSR